MRRRPDRPFDDLVLARTGSDFVERRWLYDEVTRALSADNGRYVLVLGDPGGGKTSLFAGLARENADWLRYFVAQDSRDIQSFLLSIGHQLAGQRPEIFQPARLHVEVHQDIEAVEAGGRVVGIRIEDLQTSPFHRTAMLVEQQVTKSAGRVTGIEIDRANLEPRLLEPDNLAQLALIGPARVLFAQDPSRRIVILLDGLDQLTSASDATAGLLDWLAEGPELPPNVRVIMSSRPHSSLDLIRAARAGQLAEIVIDPRSRQVNVDLLDYAERACRADDLAAVVTGAGLDLERFRRDVVDRAAGNFQYLSSYLRALADPTVNAERDLVKRLLALDELPPGLSGLYGKLVTTARVTVKRRLGMFDTRAPETPADTRVPAWEGVGQPILGVLTVARDRLTVEQLGELGGIRVWPQAVRTVVDHLRWLLEVRDDRVAFFHSSFGEYLVGEQIRRAYPALAIDKDEWHERIVRHYRGAGTWGDVDWTTVDRYGLLHIADHVASSRAAIAGTLTELVCPGLRRAMRAMLGTDQRFLSIVETAAARTIIRPPAEALPTMFYFAVVRRQLRRSNRRVVPAFLGLLARLGRIEGALAHLAALPPSRRQFEGAQEILRHALADPAHPNRHAELLDLLVEIAMTMPEDDLDRPEVLRAAARELAANDLPRALSLLDHAHAYIAADDAASDPMYQAMASVGRVDRVGRRLVSGGGSRAGDYLDLAARAAPSQVPDLLRKAEESMAAHPTTAGERMHCLARLAAAWAPFDPAKSWRSGDEVLLAAMIGSDGLHSWAGKLVMAAGALSDGQSLGPSLLDMFEDLGVDGQTHRDALLRAAGLRAAWGSPDRARRLLRLVNGDDAIIKVKVAAALGDFDEEAALRFIEQAYAAIPPWRPSRNDLEDMSRENSLESVAVELAKYDLGRAEDVAREITNTDHRYGVLAGFVHRWLDIGDTAQTTRLLDEVLDFIESAPDLVDVRPPGPYAPEASDPEQTASPFEVTAHRAFLTHHSELWQELRDTRLFLDPAEVINALMPGTGERGSPYCWARTVRVLAETIADQDPAMANYLIRSLIDCGERAVGLAAMIQVDRDPESAAQRWQEFTAALDSMERFAWVVPEQHDKVAIAYLRPDHRTRFEVAIRLIPHKWRFAMHLLGQHGTDYLQYVLREYLRRYASDAYTSSVVYRRPPFTLFQQMHQTLLMVPPAPDRHDKLMSDIVRAGAVANEYVIARATGQAPLTPPTMEDPRYAALIDLLAEGPTGPAFRLRLQSLLDGPRLPAAAELVALAAKLAPRHPSLRELCSAVIAASRTRPPMARIIALLPMAASSIFTELIDPAELLADIQGLGRLPSQAVDRDEIITKLFPILLAKTPDIAIKLLYNTVEESWSHAMALLEHGAEEILDVMGTDAATALHTAIIRAVECTSPDGTTVLDVDGVRLE